MALLLPVCRIAPKAAVILSRACPETMSITVQISAMENVQGATIVMDNYTINVAM
jgi:hypothetical protein